MLPDFLPVLLRFVHSPKIKQSLTPLLTGTRRIMKYSLFFYILCFNIPFISRNTPVLIHRYARVLVYRHYPANYLREFLGKVSPIQFLTIHHRFQFFLFCPTKGEKYIKQIDNAGNVCKIYNGLRKLNLKTKNNEVNLKPLLTFVSECWQMNKRKTRSTN